MTDRWFQPYSPMIADFFPGSENNKYALYSQSADRFLILDRYDLWSLVHAAKILSSKFSLVVCIFASQIPPFENENCLAWTLKNKDLVIPKRQTPVFYSIHSNDELEEVGLPKDFKDDLPRLNSEREFVAFVLCAVYSLRLTELKLSLSPDVYNETQNLYLDFMAVLGDIFVQPQTNKTKWKKGFSTEIGSVLYRAQSIDEALASFEKIKNSLESLEDPAERKLSQAYFDVFNSFLGRGE